MCILFVYIVESGYLNYDVCVLSISEMGFQKFG